MKIIIGADHAGFALKEALKPWLVAGGHEVVDVGASTMVPDDDYPDYVLPLVKQVLTEPVESRAIFCARSGEGEAIAANRHKGIRAVVYNQHDLELVEKTRTDNNANVFCVGSDFVTKAQIEEALVLWLSIPFDTTSRHARRLAKIDNTNT